MEPYYALKMKRKDLEDVYDEFSEFSLSSPARKIRRLDADLPPIIEEVEEPEIPIAFEQAATYPSFGSNAVNRGLVIEELPSVPENEERAIVLFKPMNTQPVHSPSNFSVKVDPQFLNGLKSQIFWDNTANAFRLVDNEETQQDDSSSAKECLAVVPWFPSQFLSAAEAEVLSQPDVSDMMDAEDMEGVAMDIEDNSVDVGPRTAVETGAVGVNDGLHHWQQQHCMTTTQLPQNTSTPIPWYR
ncbi:hypothetical protein KY290_026939 [Solanum tuberosum]|uniref:Uncharacterized protein n=1 Tax=Solanum tuberosum TaxID=4113 RepID=A0ABQ7UZL9_SOLTU|nr:hypothetical protein KY289_024427 [Solanum tuberosum]KAH0676277.1 hypothetical protein KY285_024078 [Solanum tuberosum]KAH0756669.1 hypothetical protein KY290_026939 [Solanum tuberosum]